MIVKVTAAGSVDDFDEASQLSLAKGFAQAAGVDATDVKVRVEAASVLITFTVNAGDNATAASSLATQIQSNLEVAANSSNTSSAWCPNCNGPPSFSLAATLVVLTPPSMPPTQPIVQPSLAAPYSPPPAISSSSTPSPPSLH